MNKIVSWQSFFKGNTEVSSGDKPPPYALRPSETCIVESCWCLSTRSWTPLLISLKWTSLGSLGSELHNIEGWWDAVDFLIDLGFGVLLLTCHQFSMGFSMGFSCHFFSWNHWSSRNLRWWQPLAASLCLGVSGPSSRSAGRASENVIWLALRQGDSRRMGVWWWWLEPPSVEICWDAEKAKVSS